MFPSSAFTIKPETNLFEENCREHSSLKGYNELLPVTGFDLFRNYSITGNDLNYESVSLPQLQINTQQSTQLPNQLPDRRGSDETTSSNNSDYNNANNHIIKPRKQSYNSIVSDDVDVPAIMKPVGRRGDASLHVAEDGRVLTKEEQRRLSTERNRLAAARCRKRKSLWTRSLQDEVDNLLTEQKNLKEEKEKLTYEVQELRETVSELMSQSVSTNSNYVPNNLLY